MGIQNLGHVSLPFSAKKIVRASLVTVKFSAQECFLFIIYEKEHILYLLKHFRASEISLKSFLFSAAASMPHPSPSHLPSPEHSIEY